MYRELPLLTLDVVSSRRVYRELPLLTLGVVPSRCVEDWSVSCVSRVTVTNVGRCTIALCRGSVCVVCIESYRY